MQERIKKEKRERRRRRSQVKILSTAGKPRICVFRSAKHIYAQLVPDDSSGKTIVAASDLEIKSKEKKVDRAKNVGRLLAEKANKLKIDQVVFDKSGYKYHGRVKALAEGAREGGLKF
jgi:large subunit ribosomal protein L18